MGSGNQHRPLFLDEVDQLITGILDEVRNTEPTAIQYHMPGLRADEEFVGKVTPSCLRNPTHALLVIWGADSKVTMRNFPSSISFQVLRALVEACNE